MIYVTANPKAKKEFKIPVSWEVMDFLKVQANTLEEAFDFVMNPENDALLGTSNEGDYVEGSYKVNASSVEECEIYNTGDLSSDEEHLPKVTAAGAGIEVTGITLLSEEEFREVQNCLPKRDLSAWWLRKARAGNSGVVAYVYKHNKVGYDDTYDYADCDLGVSPALIIANLSTSNLRIGDDFEWAGQAWRVVSDKYAQCLGIIGMHAFRFDCVADDADEYESSDVKKFIEWWAAQKGLVRKEGAA